MNIARRVMSTCERYGLPIGSGSALTEKRTGLLHTNTQEHQEPIWTGGVAIGPENVSGDSRSWLIATANTAESVARGKT